MDNKHQIIIGVKAERPDRGGETRAAVEMIKQSKWKFKIKPQTLGADKGYATGEFVYHVFKEEVTPHIPIMNTRSKNDKGIFPITKFSFDAERNEYICPQGKGQTPGGQVLIFELFYILWYLVLWPDRYG